MDPQTQIPPKFEIKSKDHNFLFVWITLFILLTLAGLFIFGQVNNNSEKLIENSNQISDEISGWKTYRNEEYGFEIQYPRNWFIHDLAGSAWVFAGTSQEKNEDVLGVPPSPNGLWVEINTYECDETNGYVSGSPTEILTKGMCKDGFQVGASIWENNTNLESNKLLLDQILSTFKFVNNDVQTGKLLGQVTIGPNCPVEQIDNPCKTPAEAYTSRFVEVYKPDQKTLVVRKNFNADGTYIIDLKPGNYLVKTKTGLGQTYITKNILIEKGKTVILDFDIDTGIR